MNAHSGPSWQRTPHGEEENFTRPSRVLVEVGREYQLNLKAAAVRRVLTVLAVACLLTVSARISGADFESQQPQALNAAVEASLRLSGVSLTSRISYSLFSNVPLHAKHVGELRRPSPHLPLLSKCGFVVGGICKQFSPALAFPQFGRSPPSPAI
jgi:hypothetical protein